MLLNESHDCSLELDDTDDTADQNENSDGDDDAEEDSDNEIYLLPGRRHTWAYYSHSKGGYFCKMCEIVYGDRPCPNNRSRAAWGHNGVILKDNPGRKFK